MKTFASIALVASLALAAPLEVREPALEIDVVTELAVVTQWATLFETEGAAPATTYVAPAPQTTTVAAGNGKGKGRTRTYNWHKDTTTTVAAVPTTTSEAYVPPPPPAPTTTSTTEAALPTIEAPTTTWQAPAITFPTQAPAAPTTTQAAAKAPTGQAPSAYTGDDSYSDSNLQLAIINSTNTYRTMFQAAPVTWNQSLVDMAVTSAAKCDFEHSNAGQNLAAGYSGPQGAVGGWGDEYKNFDFSHPDFGETTGHFTQLVWQDSTTVGCAAKKCPTDGSTGARGWYLICNYFPVGNMLGEFPENVKPKASGW